LVNILHYLAKILLLVSFFRPVASLLIMDGRFPQILELFHGMKIGVTSGCLGETSIFKIIMTDNLYFVIEARIYMVSLLDFINFIS